MFGFFKRPKVVAPVPSGEAEPERYKDRPLLIVLEQYVLHCIGEGGEDSAKKMVAIVQRVWGGNENWQQTVRNTLRLDPNIDDSIRDLWKRNQEIARKNNTQLHPVQFAKMIADSNFAPLLEK